jgi:hypothetical protein
VQSVHDARLPKDAMGVMVAVASARPQLGRDDTSVVQLGLPSEVLEISARDHRLFGNGPVIAVRFGHS